MTVHQAIYGSVGGLANYRVLAVSPGVDERVRMKIEYYASLEGSALSGPFAPIFSFYHVDGARWAFARTVYVGPTHRGSDYLVHALLLEAADLAREDFDPFSFADAGLFVEEKPTSSVLEPIAWAGRHQHDMAAPVRTGGVASALRALARGQLCLRLAEGADSAAVCRAIHQALPPSDRVKVTFCTRFSFRRALPFRLVAFVEADEAIVREHASATATLSSLAASEVADAADAFDVWASGLGEPSEPQAVGPSVLDRPEEAIEVRRLVRQLARWADAPTSAFDQPELQRATAIVLADHNRRRPSMQPLLVPALALDLRARVLKAVTTGQGFEEASATADQMAPQVHRGAADLMRRAEEPTLVDWIVDLLLTLPHGTVEEIAARLTAPRGSNSHLGDLGRRNPQSARALLVVALGRLHDRFGVDGAAAVMAVARASKADREPPLDLVVAVERTVRSAEPAVRDAWLLAIIRDVARPRKLPALAARLAHDHALWGKLTDEEMDWALPALLEMLDLAPARANGAAPAHVYRVLAAILPDRLRQRWLPKSLASHELLRHVLIAGASDLREGRNDGVDNLVALVYLVATKLPADLRREVSPDLVAVLAGLIETAKTPTQAGLLARAVKSLGAAGVRVPRWMALLLYVDLRVKPPVGLLARCRWYLRLCTLRGVAPA